MYVSFSVSSKPTPGAFSACQILFLLSSFLFNWYISYFHFDLSHEWTNWHVRWSRHGNRVVIHLFLLHIVHYTCTIHLPLCGFHSSRFTNAASLSDLCGFAADFCGLSHLYLCRLACQSCSNWSHHCTPRMNNLDLCMWALVVEDCLERWLSIILNWTSRAFFSNNKPFWEFVDSSQDWLSSMKWPKYDKKFFS